MQGTNNHHNQHHYHHHHHHHHHGRHSSRRNPEDSHMNLSTESCPESSSSRSPSEVVDIPFSSSSRVDNEGAAASGSPKQGFVQKHHAHHHHSIHELKRYLGKMMTHWISERGNRRSSCSDDGSKTVEEEFRGRSQSLDGAVRRGISDCEATYRIYESILKEGT